MNKYSAAANTDNFHVLSTSSPDSPDLTHHTSRLLPAKPAVTTTLAPAKKYFESAEDTADPFNFNHDDENDEDIDENEDGEDELDEINDDLEDFEKDAVRSKLKSELFRFFLP